MKRDWLKGLKITIEGKEVNLPDEVIESIMKENGTDVENTKTKLNGQIEKLQTQLTAKDEQLTNVNSEIEKFKGMNIEEIQKQVETLKTQNADFATKSKADNEAWEKKLADQARDFKLNEVVNTLKFPNELTKKAFMSELKEKNLPLEGEKFLGFDDYVKEVGEKNPGIFVVEQAPTQEKPLPEFTTPKTQSTQPKAKMSLIEMMKMKNENPNFEPPIGQ